MTETITGWPPGLLQDDCRELARWMASRPDALYRLRQLYAEEAKQMTAPKPSYFTTTNADGTLVYHPYFTTDQMVEMQGKIDELESQVAALTKDAERYRFIRANGDPNPGMGYWPDYSEAKYDAAIDSAILQSEKGTT